MASRRKPWLAALLSLGCTGLGHVYCGRMVRGIWLLSFSLLPALFAPLFALLPPWSPLLVVLVAIAAASFLLGVFALVDAWRIARKLGDDFVPQTYQRPVVYAAFLVASATYFFVWPEVVKSRLWDGYLIPTMGMAPTLTRGDKILANKLRFRRSPVQRGDVVLHWEQDERMGPLLFARRVIGLPGDRVEFRDGRVIVNGQPLPVEPSGDEDGTMRERAGERWYRVTAGASFSRDAPEVSLGDGQYYLLGDNRPVSRDSRITGPVDARDFVGTVEYIFRPAEGWSRAGALDDE